METMRRTLRLAAVALVPLFFSACFSVYVVKDARNPKTHLKRAQDEIQRLELRYPRRNRRANTIHLLVFEKDSGSLVKFSAPLWFVNSCLNMGMKIARRHAEFDFEDKFDVEWQALRGLGKIGPGLLVEVFAEDTEVLIWLK